MRSATTALMNHTAPTNSGLTPTAPVDPLVFRDAMARMGAAVNIVTTGGPHGTAGFAATAVCSVTDAPPSLLVCLQRSSSAHPAVTGNGVLCVNVLECGHESLCRLFGGKTPMAERFASGRWFVLSTGSPALAGARTVFDCRVTQCVQMGTHDVLFCEVVALSLGAGGAPGLYYEGRGYRKLAAMS